MYRVRVENPVASYPMYSLCGGKTECITSLVEDRLSNKGTDAQTDGQMKDGRTAARQMDGQVGGWVDGKTDRRRKHLI